MASLKRSRHLINAHVVKILQTLHRHLQYMTQTKFMTFRAIENRLLLNT